MILADTSIWIDHLAGADETMSKRLGAGLIMVHPFVVGELAMGNLRDRVGMLATLRKMPTATKARDVEVLELVERERLFGLGLGLVDAHLLASTLLTEDTTLWTRDRRLYAVAERLGVAAPPSTRASH